MPHPDAAAARHAARAHALPEPLVRPASPAARRRRGDCMLGGPHRAPARLRRSPARPLPRRSSPT